MWVNHSFSLASEYLTYLCSLCVYINFYISSMPIIYNYNFFHFKNYIKLYKNYMLDGITHTHTHTPTPTPTPTHKESVSIHCIWGILYSYFVWSQLWGIVMSWNVISGLKVMAYASPGGVWLNYRLLASMSGYIAYCVIINKLHKVSCN